MGCFFGVVEGPAYWEGMNMKAKLLKTMVAMAAALALAFCLVGCGGGEPADPNLGVYQGSSCTVLGEETDLSEIYAEGENYLELMEEGQCIMCLDGGKIKSQYVIEGENITITTEEGGQTYESAGTISGGQVTVDFCGLGMVINFAKTAE